MQTSRTLILLSLAAGLALSQPMAARARDEKPSMKLRASSAMSFTPARLVFTAELRNVTNEDAELYCPLVEWEWGDGTQSSSTTDCEPFEAGKTPIQLRYVKSHTYDVPGRFQVWLRLRRGQTTLLAASTTVTVRGGLPYDQP
jgi:hypothetical protein